MKRLKVGVDIDGVLADFTGAARKFFKANYGIPDDELIQNEWDFYCLGVTKEMDKALWQHISTTPNWWVSLDPLPGAYKLGWLVKNHLVYFLTNRSESQTDFPIEVQTRRWLYDTHGLDETNLIVCKNKGMLAAALGLDYFIDDNIPNVQDVLDKAPSCATFIKEMPYNLDSGVAPYLANVNQLADIVEAVEALHV